jgi:hypothetical protein
VILSKKHGYESIGLGFHQNTMTLDSWLSCTFQTHPSFFPTVSSRHLVRDDTFKKTREFVGVPRIIRYFTTENS